MLRKLLLAAVPLAALAVVGMSLPTSSAAVPVKDVKLAGIADKADRASPDKLTRYPFRPVSVRPVVRPFEIRPFNIRPINIRTIAVRPINVRPVNAFPGPGPIDVRPVSIRPVSLQPVSVRAVLSPPIEF